MGSLPVADWLSAPRGGGNMGNAQLTPKEMMEMTMQMKIQSKMLNRSATRCDKESGKEKLKVRQAMEKGNNEGARLYAENAIRQKNQAMVHRRLAARLDAVASKLESCQNSMKVAHNLGVITQRLGPSLNAMNIAQISQTMDDFEQVLEDQDVMTDTITGAIDTATSTMTPADAVDDMINEVADEHNIERGQQFGNANRIANESEAARVRQLNAEEDAALDQRLA